MSDLTTSARSLIATARYRIGTGVSPSVEPFIDLAEKLAGELERIVAEHAAGPSGTHCISPDCNDELGQPVRFPCATIRALDGAT